MKTAIILIASIMTWLLAGCSSPEQMAIMSWQNTIDRHFSSIEPYFKNPAVDKSQAQGVAKFPAESPAIKGDWLYVYYGGHNKYPRTSVEGFNYWIILPTNVNVDAIYLGRYDLGGVPGDLFLLSVQRNTWHGTGQTTVTMAVQPAFRTLSGDWIEGVNNMTAVHYDNQPPDKFGLSFREDYQVVPAAQELDIILRAPDLNWAIPARK